MWGVIYLIGHVIFKCFFFANSCFVLNVCKVVIFPSVVVNLFLNLG